MPPPNDPKAQMSQFSQMPRVSMPERLQLGENAVKQWKLFKQRWESYALISKLHNLSLEEQKAIFI